MDQDIGPEWLEELHQWLGQLENASQFDPDSFLATIDRASHRWVDELTRDPRRTLAERRSWSLAFNHRLVARWGQALDLYEIAQLLATEAGRTKHAWAQERSESPDVVFQVMERLHARGCRVASAILVLMRTGHATDAHARWRTLHELAVTGYFIKSHGVDTAVRYLDHNTIESFHALQDYTRYRSLLNVESIPDAEIVEIREQHRQLLEKYGKDFDKPYGWANHAMGFSPSFRDIEENVGMDRLRPYYRMASHGVHAGPKGILWNLEVIGDRDMLLAGPSNAGLADPGHASMISLHQLTTILLAYEPSIEDTLYMKAIQRLVDLGGDAFLSIHSELLAEETNEGAPD